MIKVKKALDVLNGDLSDSNWDCECCKWTGETSKFEE